MPADPEATVIIVTRNRAEEVRRAIQSVLAQDVPVELIVYDDGSLDNTSDVVREFDGIELRRSEQSVGYVFHRNAGVVAAKAKIVIIMDDDATMTDPATIRRTLEDFRHPRVGAVAVPFSEYGRTERQPQAPNDHRVWVTNMFIGAVHGLRRDLFVRLGGFRYALRHFGEEADYCLRLLSRGFVVRRGTALPAVHELSAIRDRKMEDYYAIRNHIYGTWNCTPLALALVKMIAITGKEVLTDERHRFKLRTIGALAGGWGACVTARTSRDAPTFSTYNLYHELKRRKTVLLDEIEPRLISFQKATWPAHAVLDGVRPITPAQDVPATNRPHMDDIPV
jgi:glycosyltransferase involved in cell wall biosynthesis